MYNYWRSISICHDEKEIIYQKYFIIILIIYIPTYILLYYINHLYTYIKYIKIPIQPP